MTFENFEPIYLTIHEEGNATVATFQSQRLSDEVNVEQLGHELISLVEQFGCRKIVLELKNVEYATSSVLGKLITLHRKLHRDGGKLCLCGLTDPMKTIFRTSRLINYFEIAEDVDQAVKAVA